MTNILHLSHTDIVSDSRILKEMAALSIQGNKVSGIGIKDRSDSGRSSCPGNIRVYSIYLWTRKLTLLPTLLRHILSLFEFFWKVSYRAIKLKPDVIHCNDILVLPLGVILKIFTDSHIIYDAHELESEAYGLSKTKKKIIFYTEKLLWRYIDALIVVSPSIDNWYKKNMGSKYSQVILNSPVLKTDSIVYDKNYLRRHFSISEDSIIYIYIGGLINGRGIDLIVEAFKISEMKSCVVFLGYGEWSEKLKALATKHKNIYVHDAVPHEKVVSIAQSADIGLCLIQNVALSNYYCLPNRLLEYCFAGIPVLASNFPDISNIVNTYNLGVCCKPDLESISNSIKKLEKSRDINFSVNDLYEISWEAQEKKLLRLYDYISSNKASSS